MKLNKTKLCTALLGVAVFAASVASAEPGYFTISGTATTDKSTTTGSAIVKKAFSTKDVLTLLANATGNLWISNKNSHLLYDRNAYNAVASNWYGEEVYGIFWATNTTTHASYRLDNSSTLSTYWSYIELDYYEWDLGFWDPYELSDYGLGENHAQSDVNTATKESGKQLGSDAVLYVHDYPYDFDYPDFGSDVLFDANDNAFVIRGPITLTWNDTSARNSGTILIQGAGDSAFYISGPGWVYPVITGKATWSGKGPSGP